MKALQARLEKAGVWSIKLELELKALWKYGVERIGDHHLRETISSFLCVVPVIFFTDHASRSGRFHPYWQNGKNGTLRSIVESCVLVPDMAHYIPELLDATLAPDPRAIDVALAATIISDTWKKEDVGDIHHGADHGRVAAEVWRKFASARRLDAALVEEVAEGSVWHYGVHTPGWTRDIKLPPVAWLVHLCDAFTAQASLGLIYQGKAVIS